jgi:hypothetical protein
MRTLCLVAVVFLLFSFGFIQSMENSNEVAPQHSGSDSPLNAATPSSSIDATQVQHFFASLQSSYTFHVISIFRRNFFAPSLEHIDEKQLNAINLFPVRKFEDYVLDFLFERQLDPFETFSRIISAFLQEFYKSLVPVQASMDLSSAFSSSDPPDSIFNNFYQNLKVLRTKKSPLILRQHLKSLSIVVNLYLTTFQLVAVAGLSAIMACHPLIHAAYSSLIYNLFCLDTLPPSHNLDAVLKLFPFYVNPRIRPLVESSVVFKIYLLSMCTFYMILPFYQLHLYFKIHPWIFHLFDARLKDNLCSIIHVATPFLETLQVYLGAGLNSPDFIAVNTVANNVSKNLAEYIILVPLKKIIDIASKDISAFFYRKLTPIRGGWPSRATLRVPLNLTLKTQPTEVRN